MTPKPISDSEFQRIQCPSIVERQKCTFHSDCDSDCVLFVQMLPPVFFSLLPRFNSSSECANLTYVISCVRYAINAKIDEIVKLVFKVRLFKPNRR